MATRQRPHTPYQDGQSRLGLVCPEVDPERPVFCGAAGLRRARVHVSAPCDLEAVETGGGNFQLKLSFQEGTRNSTGPQVDLVARAVWHGMLNQQVANLQSTAWLQHAGHLGQPDMLVRQQIEHSIADDDVGPPVLYR
jgi:hypothetical protein